VTPRQHIGLVSDLFHATLFLNVPSPRNRLFQCDESFCPSKEACLIPWKFHSILICPMPCYEIRCCCSVNNDTILVIDFMNLKIETAQFFGDDHRSRLCVFM
jgi:hypothetical protein